MVLPRCFIHFMKRTTLFSFVIVKVPHTGVDTDTNHKTSTNISQDDFTKNDSKTVFGR
jgi:hypothetical protein